MNHYILDNPYHLSLLAELGDPKTVQPQVSRIIDRLYDSMFNTVVSRELEKEEISADTRLKAIEGNRGVWKGKVIARDQKAVVADVIRAGIHPSHLFYTRLTEILNPAMVRQDHIMAQRVEATDGHVAGTSLSGSKIGGPIDNAVVFIPDPMGATGGSALEVIDHYLQKYGMPKMFVMVNLVVAPEYLRALEPAQAPVVVYAARLDGGLTDHDYIWPGLGGVGELINNTEK